MRARDGVTCCRGLHSTRLPAATKQEEPPFAPTNHLPRQHPRAIDRGRPYSLWRLSPPPRPSRDARRNTKATDATLPASGAGDIYCQAAGGDAHAHSAFLSCFNRPSPVQQLVDDEHLDRRDCRKLDAGVQEVIL